MNHGMILNDWEKRTFTEEGVFLYLRKQGEGPEEHGIGDQGPVEDNG